MAKWFSSGIYVGWGLYVNWGLGLGFSKRFGVGVKMGLEKRAKILLCRRTEESISPSNHITMLCTFAYLSTA